MMQTARSILKKIHAEKTVLEFQPQKFELGTPTQALEYLHVKAQGSDFRMNDEIRRQTGVDQIEADSENERAEVKALEKLKEIQEEAYRTGYELGLQEGHRKAFDSQEAVLKEKLSEFEELMRSLTQMKKEIASFNESHLVQLTFHMASKIAQTHLESNNDALVEIIRQAVTLSQDEENIRVQVSSSQFEFIEELRKLQNREFEFLKKIKFEPETDLAPGGCVVETNFGEVDASLPQRLQLLWENLKENTPRVKDRIESGD